jgi:hypothetical protein
MIDSNNKTALLFSMAAVLSLSACTALIESARPGDKNNTGLVYSLPKGYIKVDASRSVVTSSDAEKAQNTVQNAETALSDDQKALADAKAKLESSSGELGYASGSAQDELSKLKLISQAQVSYLTSKIDSDKNALKKSINDASSASNNVGKLAETISITALQVSADPRERYIANQNHWWTRDDNLNLKVSGGLLSSIATVSTDQTPQILVKLAQIAAIVAGVGSSPTSSLPRSTFMGPMIPRNLHNCDPYQFSWVFDPTNNEEIQNALLKLSSKTNSFILDIDGTHCTINENCGFPATGERDYEKDDLFNIKNMKNASVKYIDGLAYRTQKSVTVTVAAPNLYADAVPATCSANTSVSDIQSFVAVFPDSSQTFILPSVAGPFTTSTSNFVFENGMPSQYTLDRPSEINAALSIPLDIAKAIISAPTELVKLKLDYSSQANALTKAETDAINAQADMLKAQNSLNALRTPATATQ